MPGTDDERSGDERTDDAGRPEQEDDADGVTREENVRSPQQEGPRPWSQKEMEDAGPYPVPEITDDDEP